MLLVAFAVVGLSADAVEGFPLSRSHPQPVMWFGALLIGGAASLVGEWAFGWILDGDHATDPILVRAGRMAILGAAVIFIAVALTLAARVLGHAWHL